MGADHLNMEIGLKLEVEEETFESCPYCPQGYLMPVYDQYPKWLEFCLHYNYQIENENCSPLPY
ncbi:hypothetical protein P4U07_26045 [Bacillus mycoides]|uniref:hypothetical protein n=1 Tax=Bacillus mycoides TaxID=1405 RepID=UPI002E1C0DF4|nr:hypothetical protein [Bacillus mycoides]